MLTSTPFCPSHVPPSVCPACSLSCFPSKQAADLDPQSPSVRYAVALHRILSARSTGSGGVAPPVPLSVAQQQLQWAQHELQGLLPDGPAGCDAVWGAPDARAGGDAGAGPDGRGGGESKAGGAEGRVGERRKRDDDEEGLGGASKGGPRGRGATTSAPSPSASPGASASAGASGTGSVGAAGTASAAGDRCGVPREAVWHALASALDAEAQLLLHHLANRNPPSEAGGDAEAGADAAVGSSPGRVDGVPQRAEGGALRGDSATQLSGAGLMAEELEARARELLARREAILIQKVSGAERLPCT